MSQKHQNICDSSQRPQWARNIKTSVTPPKDLNEPETSKHLWLLPKGWHITSNYHLTADCLEEYIAYRFWLMKAMKIRSLCPQPLGFFLTLSHTCHICSCRLGQDIHVNSGSMPCPKDPNTLIFFSDFVEAGEGEEKCEWFQTVKKIGQVILAWWIFKSPIKELPRSKAKISIFCYGSPNDHCLLPAPFHIVPSHLTTCRFLVAHIPWDVVFVMGGIAGLVLVGLISVYQVSMALIILTIGSSWCSACYHTIRPAGHHNPLSPLSSLSSSFSCFRTGVSYHPFSSSEMSRLYIMTLYKSRWRWVHLRTFTHAPVWNYMYVCMYVCMKVCRFLYRFFIWFGSLKIC